MRWEVNLPARMDIFALRLAGLDSDEVLRLRFRVLERKATLPAEVSCPYLFSDRPVTVRVIVFTFGAPARVDTRVNPDGTISSSGILSPGVATRYAFDVDDEEVGGRIRERLQCYSVENDGQAVSDREHRALWTRIEAILKLDGASYEKLQRRELILSRPAIESLMQLCEETEHPRKSNIYDLFNDQWVRKADRAFVAPWLVNLFANESDPGERSEISCRIDDLAVPQIADDLIRLLQDRRYGPSRGLLCLALAKTRDPRAAGIIASVLDDDGVTRWALEALGKLRAGAHAESVRRFLRHRDASVRREAKRTLKKLGFPVETPPPPAHLVKNRRSMPKSLGEWSTNLGIEEFSPTLEELSRCIDRGFGRQEIAEVAGVVDEMKPDQTRIFRFPVIANEENREVWLEIFLDDIDSPDLGVYAAPEIIRKFAERIAR